MDNESLDKMDMLGALMDLVLEIEVIMKNLLQALINDDFDESD
ncbi:20045_t:CDS:2, partial [Gigaspora margarita]